MHGEKMRITFAVLFFVNHCNFKRFFYDVYYILQKTSFESINIRLLNNILNFNIKFQFQYYISKVFRTGERGDYDKNLNVYTGGF